MARVDSCVGQRWFCRLLTVVVTSSLAPALSPVSAQGFGSEWVGFQKDNSRMSAAPELGLGDSEEKDYVWADFDQDGWIDLACARKQPFTSSGRRANVLFMNEGGTLVDRTAQYAAASDVGGDQGFLTPTNDRDINAGDFDGDGWIDLVTATTLSDGQPKHVSHPRIYMNLGVDGSGNWLGFRHEDGRTPQLLLSNGSPSWPRFCSVGVGDLTGDGLDDLYFGDYDSGGSGGGDMNDRLLVNDGSGFFADESALRMTSQMLESAFGMASVVADMNADGVNDVVKDTALNAPQYVAVIYNDPDDEGHFDLFDDFHSFAPYHTNVGDLNNDGTLDLVVTDDGADRYRYNTGTDIFGRVTWGPARTFQFLSGSDDGFGGNNLIVDLDDDGWEDIIITDVDVDISGCSRRAHIYHNPGGSIGQEITLIEEAEQSGNGGWKGVVGITADDLRGTHDVAVFDIDNDGDQDLVFGRCTGTDLWLNTLDPKEAPVGTPFCLGDGGGTPCPCGNDSTAGGCDNSNAGTGGCELSGSGEALLGSDTVVLSVSGAIPGGPGLFYQGGSEANGGDGVVYGDGLRCCDPSLIRLEITFADSAGGCATTVEISNVENNLILPGESRVYQLWYRDPTGGACGAKFNLSNGYRIDWN